MPRRFFFRLHTFTIPNGDAEHVSDGVLLQRFARDRDSAALELLVRRHADTVWTACRRVLASGSDAEDAFQATFLILVQKAGTVRSASIGGWLHRVAVNAALKLRERSARLPIATVNQLEKLPAHSNDELNHCGIVQEELACLPERYRLPVVLCELEGHSHAEAAKVLGWPVGSVSGRLSRARALLRKRLARRGVTAPAVLLPAIGLPPVIIRDTTTIAIGGAAILPRISNLTKGVLVAMRTAKFKLIAAWVMPIGLVVLAGFGSYAALGQRPDLPILKEPNASLVAQDKKEQLTPALTAATPLKVPKELLEKRLEAARNVYTQNLTRVKAATGIPSELYGWSERWLEAELALADKQGDRVKALRNHLDRTREVERVALSHVVAGHAVKAEGEAATYYRVEAEIRLLNEGVEPHAVKEDKGIQEKK